MSKSKAEVQRLYGLVSGMAATFGRELDEPALAAYRMALDDLAIEDLERATAQAMRTCQFMPTVAELRRLAGVDVSSKTRIALAFDALTRAVIRCGAYRTVRFDDPILNSAVASLGGWEKVCDTTDDDWQSHFRHRFGEVYAANLEAKRGTMHPLVGIHDRENGFNGFEERQPVQEIASGLPKLPGLSYEEPAIRKAIGLEALKLKDVG